MKVILQENVEGLGYLGDVLTVADGYARNFLLPRKKAVLAEERQVKLLQHLKRQIDQKAKKEVEALGDIGKHFPDTSSEYENADSMDLLKHVYALIQAKGYSLVNADITIAAQAPKLASFIIAMRTNIADSLELDVDQISVKATTTEKLGFVGRQEGIETHAVVLIQKC